MELCAACALLRLRLVSFAGKPLSHRGSSGLAAAWQLTLQWQHAQCCRLTCSSERGLLHSSVLTAASGSIEARLCCVVGGLEAVGALCTLHADVGGQQLPPSSSVVGGEGQQRRAH